MAKPGMPSSAPRRTQRLAVLGPVVATAAAAALLLAFAWRVEQNRRIEQGRAALAVEVEAIRAHLASRLAAAVAPLEGMAMLIGAGSVPPATALQAVGPQIEAREACFVSLAFAPDLVIRDVYPRALNAAAIGLDFRAPPGDQGALEAMRRQRMVMTDPFELRQGGKAVVIRLPYGRLDDPAGRGHGLLGLALDLPCLMADAGIDRIAARQPAQLVALDDAGRPRAVVHGHAPPATRDRLSVDITVPGGRWRWTVDAVPREARSPWNATLAVGLPLAALLVLAAGGLARCRAAQYLTEQP